MGETDIEAITPGNVSTTSAFPPAEPTFEKRRLFPAITHLLVHLPLPLRSCSPWEMFTAAIARGSIFCFTLRASAAPHSTVHVVEPMTAEHEHGNVNPIGQLVSAALALVCTPNGPASGGHAIGAITTEKTLCQTLAAGRFLRFRRATETPFNLVFEARP